MRADFIDLTGQKFNKLTVIEYAGKNRFNKILWRCLCECGNYTVVVGSVIKRGVTKSCGCLNNGN